MPEKIDKVNQSIFCMVTNEIAECVELEKSSSFYRKEITPNLTRHSLAEAIISHSKTLHATVMEKEMTFLSIFLMVLSCRDFVT